MKLMEKIDVLCSTKQRRTCLWAKVLCHESNYQQWNEVPSTDLSQYSEVSGQLLAECFMFWLLYIQGYQWTEGCWDPELACSLTGIKPVKLTVSHSNKWK